MHTAAVAAAGDAAAAAAAAASAGNRRRFINVFCTGNKATFSIGRGMRLNRPTASDETSNKDVADAFLWIDFSIQRL